MLKDGIEEAKNNIIIDNNDKKPSNNKNEILMEGADANVNAYDKHLVPK